MSFRWIWVVVLVVVFAVVCVTAQDDDMFSLSEWNKFETRQGSLLFPKIDQYFGTTHSLRHDGLRRWFMEYKPKRLKDNSPLVIQLHWGGGNMRSSSYLGRIIEKDLWLKLSKKHGFLVLSPNGTAKRKHFKGLNTYGMSQEWFDILGQGPANTGADDVGFIKAIVDWAVKKRKIDPNRVYVSGISAGGLMTYKLLVEAPGVFAAAAVFGSNLPLRPMSNLTVATPILMVSGTNDRRMPWEGRTDGGGVGRGGLRSAEATRDYFVTSNAAGPVNETALPDVDPNDGCRIYLQYYHSVTAPVAFYRMEGGGHVPPGITYKRFEEAFLDDALGRTCHDIIGIEVAWEFMSKYTL